MKRLPRWLAYAVLLLSLVATLSPGAVWAFEPPKTPLAVTDLADALDAKQRAALDARLAAYRKRTTNEVAVFVVARLDGEAIEDAAYKTFNAWRLGAKGKDNGVLLMIATGDRRMRIETGKGVGGALTDLEAGRILRDRMKPFLARGEVARAIDVGLDAIEAQLDDRPEPPLPAVVDAVDAGAPRADERPFPANEKYWFDVAGVFDGASLAAANAAAAADPRFAEVCVVIAPTLERKREYAQRARDAKGLFATVFVIGVEDREIDFFYAFDRNVLAYEHTGALDRKLKAAGPVDAPRIRAMTDMMLARLFPPPPPGMPAWQIAAIAFAVAVVVGAIAAFAIWDARRRRRARDAGWSEDIVGSAGDGIASSSTSGSMFGSSSGSSSSSSSSAGGGGIGGGGSSGGGGASDSW